MILRKNIKVGRFQYFTKRILIRSLIIVMVPLFISQVIAFSFFYYNHWEAVSNKLSESVQGEMVSSISILQNHPEAFPILQKMYSRWLGTDLKYYPSKVLNYEEEVSQFSLFGDPLGSDFRSIDNYKSQIIRLTERPRYFVYQVQLEDGVMEMVFIDKRLVSPTIATFLAWLIVSFITMIVISTYIIHLQVRPILILAKSAQRLGQGKDIRNIPLLGAYEVKTAIAAFNQMNRRLAELKKQKKTMLRALSHDIRAPLARLQVMTSFMKKSAEKKAIQNDIEFIDNMLRQYVDFVFTDIDEEVLQIDLSSELVVLSKIYHSYIDIVLKMPKESVILLIRKHSLKRLFCNLLDNAIKHADKIIITLKVNNNNMTIAFEDNGPGIPVKLRKKAFLPFFRIDKARTPDPTPSTGLGLALCQGIVEQYEGRISLTSSKTLGGVKVIVKFPTS